MSETWQFDPARIGEELHEIQAWCHGNGLDPNEVPTDAKVVFDLGSITVDVYCRNERGAKYVEPGTDRIARTTKTVPYVCVSGLRSLVKISD